MAPQDFTRRILLAVTGLNPQVVTETLYALAVQAERPFVPTEIHLITTEAGAERAELGLLDPAKGRFHQFCSDFGFTGAIHFPAEHIHVLQGADGRPLTDIRTEADNEAAADAITELVRHHTADPDSALHVSLAGGRKTLGFYLGYGLSLFGRPQDRLSHVLVSEPFESEPQFFYPPPEPEVLFLSRDNRPVRTDNATITLADIPFVRLRAGLPEALRAGRRPYSEVVHSLEAAMGPVALTIDTERGRIRCGQAVLAPQPQLLALIAWMARRRKDGEGPIPWREADPEGFLAEYTALEGELSYNLEQARQVLAEGDAEDRNRFFQEKRARYNRLIREQLGEWGEHYVIQSQGERPRTSYGLRLDPDRIHFGPVEEEPSA